jgi:predicted glutamine amidotransferase
VCGIAGFFVSNPERIRATSLQVLAQSLLLGIETRGRDAAGYAYVSVKDKFAHIAKAPVTASDFLELPGHLLSKDNIKRMPRSLLLHTRAATQGLPSDNRNNHPVYSKLTGLTITHNGWLLNDDDIITHFDLKKDAEVDSETYLRLIDKFYTQGEVRTVESAIKQATQHVYGSIACAMFQGGRPSTLWLWRDLGDLFLIKTDWGYIYASTDDILLEAAYESCTALDLPWWEIIDTPPATLLTITLDGITYHDLETPDFSASDYKEQVYEVTINGQTKRRRKQATTWNYEDYMCGNMYSRTPIEGNTGQANNGHGYTPYWQKTHAAECGCHMCGVASAAHKRVKEKQQNDQHSGEQSKITPTGNHSSFTPAGNSSLLPVVTKREESSYLATADKPDQASSEGEAERACRLEETEVVTEIDPCLWDEE